MEIHFTNKGINYDQTYSSLETKRLCRRSHETTKRIKDQRVVGRNSAYHNRSAPIAMLKLEVGLNFETSSDAADISLYTEFESREALNAYQIHPAHMPAKKIIPLVRLERRVADYEI